MNSLGKYALLLALGVGISGGRAVAQNVAVRDVSGVQLQGGAIVNADWDDHRCDGDHDRDDRGCYGVYRGPYIGNSYYANQYYPGGLRGWYDRKGNFYPEGANGYFDKHGKWHALKGHRDHDRDDR